MSNNCEKNLLQLDKLKKKKDLFNIYKNKLVNYIKILDENITNIDNSIYNICEHDWIPDRNSYEPCGPTPMICSKCGNY